MNTSLSRLPNFDPRKIPVVDSDDSSLPAIAADRLLAAALRQRFAAPPVAWQPEVVHEPKFMERPPARAAVLVPIVLRESKPTVLLTERTAHLSTHSGQIAFPGGKADEGDVDAAATALREAHEEIGLERRFIDVLGTLPVYTTGSAFVITPVVALVEPGFVLTLNTFEVAAAFEVPLDFVMNPANHRRHRIEWEGFRREWFSMPWHDDAAHEWFIWGATAGMLRNFYRFLAA